MGTGSVRRNETHENGQVDARRTRRGAGRHGRRRCASRSREARSWDDDVVQARLSSDVDRTFLFRSTRTRVDVRHDASHAHVCVPRFHDVSRTRVGHVHPFREETLDFERDRMVLTFAPHPHPGFEKKLPDPWLVCECSAPGVRIGMFSMEFIRGSSHV